MNHSQDQETIGRVVGLWRYPVKSMAGEAVAETHLSWQGFDGDRRWAFVRDGVASSGFPWLTLRECSSMSHYRPWFADPTRPDTSPTTVRTPSGAEFDVTDPGLATELSPRGAHVIRQARGVFDAFPLSLITTQTVAQLSESVGVELDVQRFRPNILVEASEDLPFLEDTWVGSVLCLGGTRMRVDQRDGRCLVITIDPKTTERNPEILRAVAKDRGGCLGVYGSTVTPGRIALNDPVIIE